MQKINLSFVEKLKEKNCQQIATLYLHVLNERKKVEKKMDEIAIHIGYYAFKRKKLPWSSLFRAINEGNLLRIKACAETDKEKQLILWKEAENGSNNDSSITHRPLNNHKLSNYSRNEELSGLTSQEVASKYLKFTEEHIMRQRLVNVITGHVGYCAQNRENPSWKTLFSILKNCDINRINTFIRTESNKKVEAKVSSIKKLDGITPEKATDWTKRTSPPVFKAIPTPNLAAKIGFATPPSLDDIKKFSTDETDIGVTKTFICLANSVKKGGSCIAGREWHENRAGKWLRVVHPQTDCLMDPQNKYKNNQSPQLFDIIEVDLLKPCSVGHQTENWEIQSSTRLRCIGKYSNKSSDIEKLLEPSSSEDLWIDGSKPAANDRVDSSNIRKFDDSLRFIFLPLVKLYKTINQNVNDAVRAEFKHMGKTYDLAVKDPCIFSKIFNTDSINSDNYKQIPRYRGRKCQEIAEIYTNLKDSNEKFYIAQHVGYQSFKNKKMYWQMLFHGIISDDMLRIKIRAATDKNEKHNLIQFVNKRDRSNPIFFEKCYATISLASNFKNNHFKLLAALIPFKNS